MESSKRSYERQFRSVFLRVCEDMGKEKWKSFLFVLSVPESVSEKGRSDVLNYLVQNGQVSSEKPQDLVSLLRDDLRRDDLAARVETFMTDWEEARFLPLPAPTVQSVASLPEPPAESAVQRPALLPTAVEARPKRRTHSPDRRYAKVFTPAEVDNTLQLPDPGFRDEATPTDEPEERLGLVYGRDRGESLSRQIEIYGTLPRRGKNDLTPARDSNCSSGYFSSRSSVVSRESVISLQSIPSMDANIPLLIPSLHLLSLQDLSPTPNPRALSRLESSSSSASSTSSDEDFQSCTSGSTEDLLDSRGIVCSHLRCGVHKRTVHMTPCHIMS